MKINKLGKEGWFNPEKLRQDVEDGKITSFSVYYHEKGKHKPHIDLNITTSNGEKKAYRLYNTENLPAYNLPPGEVRILNSQGVFKTKPGELDLNDYLNFDTKFLYEKD